MREKTISGNFCLPHSAGSVCIAHPAHPIAKPLIIIIVGVDVVVLVVTFIFIYGEKSKGYGLNLINPVFSGL